MEDLIERLEKETKCRVDDNNGENHAMNGLFGAVARLMGKAPRNCQPCDDVAVGVLIRHQMSPQYQIERQQKETIATLLLAGLPPGFLQEGSK